MAHFLVVYVFATLACEHAAAGAAAATVVALAGFIAIGVPDYRHWRAAQGETLAFVALTSLLLCALSALAALWVAYPAFVLPACGD